MTRVRLLAVVSAILAQASSLSRAADPASAARPEVAAIYFPSWHVDDHYSSWYGEGWNEWRLIDSNPPRFPGHHNVRPAREWGYFDEADTAWMARQIDTARQYGVDVFVFDWYRFPAQPFEEYSHFVERHESYWDHMDTGALPYGPVVTVGWDVTPRWEHRVPWPPEKNHYPYTPIVVNNTPERFGELVRRGLRQIATARLKPPALFVNSWNEWTEGSALLPQEKYGRGYLEALKNALEAGPLPPVAGAVERGNN